MKKNLKTNKKRKSIVPEGLPVVRGNVAGMDVGSQEHWVCAPPKGRWNSKRQDIWNNDT